MEWESHDIASFDGTRIHYKSLGNGPVICACNGIGVSTFFWKYLAGHFCKTHRILLWDYRFHGQSGAGPDYGSLTMTTNARDLVCVLDHAGVDKALLTGHSMGVQTILEFHRLFPGRCAGLIPVLGAYGAPMDTFLGTDLVKHLFPLGFYTAFLFPNAAGMAAQALYKVLFSSPVAFRGAKLIRFINSQLFREEDLKPYLDHLRSLDLRAFMAMARRMQEHSVKTVLPGIQVPVLIIAGEDDLFTPLAISEEMHSLIPDSELLVIPRGSHAALVEQPELMNLRIEKFIRERLGESDTKLRSKK